MKKILLKPMQHQGEECIGIFFEIDLKINGMLRKTGVVKFSETNKCWYTRLSKENYNKIVVALQGVATFEQSLLHHYLSERKQQKTDPAKAVPGNKEIARQKLPAVWVEQKTIYYKKERVSLINAHVLKKMEEHLKLKSYSSSTQRTYLQEMSHLLSLLKDIPADELTPDHLKRYFLYCYDHFRVKLSAFAVKIYLL